MLGRVEYCLVLFIRGLNMTEGFKWPRAKVKQSLKGFSFLHFVWCVCVFCYSPFSYYYYCWGFYFFVCALIINFC